MGAFYDRVFWILAAGYFDSADQQALVELFDASSEVDHDALLTLELAIAFGHVQDFRFACETTFDVL